MNFNQCRFFNIFRKNGPVKQNVFLLVLLGILTFHGLINYQVLTRGNSCYIYDEYVRVSSGYSAFQDIFITPGLSFQERTQWFFQLDNGQGHPHLFELIEAFSWKILAAFGKTDPGLVILLANLFFLFILLSSVYEIGSVLYDKRTGLLAALLGSMLPMVFGLSRVAMLDYPLMCMCSLSCCLLLKTNRFVSVKYSVLFGVIFGLTELTKESAVIFLGPLVIYYFINSLRKGGSKKAVVGFLAGMLSFLIVTGIVYLRADNPHVYGTYISKMHIVNSVSFFYYFHTFKDFVGPWVLIVSFPFFLSYWVKFKERDWILFFWFFIPFILFSLSPNKTTRFMMPLAPVWALLIARGVLVNDWPKLVRRISVFIFIIVLTAQYAAYNLEWLLPPEGYVLEKGRLSVEHDPYAATVTGLVHVFNEEASAVDAPAMVIPLFNTGAINDSLGLDFNLARLPFWVMCPIELDEVDAQHSSWKGFPQEILMGHYILDKVEAPDMHTNSEINFIGRGLRAGFLKYRDHFEKIAEVPVYDNSRVDVYRRIKR